MSEVYQRVVRAKENKNWQELYQCLQTLETTSLEESEWQGLLVILEESLKEEDFQARWDLIKILPHFGTALSEPLIKLLEDEEQEVELRWFIIQVLGQLKTPAVVLALTRLLQTTEEESLLEMASQTLAQIGANSIEELSKLLAVENLRGLVIETLSRIIHPSVIPYLSAAYRDPAAKIRYTVISALSSFPDPQLRDILLLALQDTSADVRKQSLIGLKYWCREQKKADLLVAIQPLLYDLQIEVSQQAIVNLAELGGIEATRELGRLLESPLTPLQLKIYTIRALSSLETTRALKCLEESLKSEKDLSLLKEIITVLGRLKNQSLKLEAVRILEEFYHSELEEEIKVAIAVTFGELAQPQSYRILESLKEESIARIRLHAIAALRKLSH